MTRTTFETTLFINNPCYLYFKFYCFWFYKFSFLDLYSSFKLFTVPFWLKGNSVKIRYCPATVMNIISLANTTVSCKRWEGAKPKVQSQEACREKSIYSTSVGEVRLFQSVAKLLAASCFQITFD